MRSLLLRSAAALALVGVSASALADPRIEINGGRSYSDGYWTNTAWIEGIWGEHALSNSRITWAPMASLGFINGRNVAKYGNAVSDDVWLGGGGFRIRYGGANDWYHHLFWNAEVAVQGGRTLALSSGGEFINSIGWSGDHWTFQIRHASNAGIKGSNRGETMALVGFAFNP
ncbi:lipid A 3-O-deacylase [Dyella telluris]|uniref:Lipid A 3-O-deacylase n=1 Tax=Dyella telluris TaxID=2763498 RepID=A0A7G8Q993_9GAMM|nr:lipid A 3-O-deacylase [Dyella telluris]QNK03351.1 lipid A 3-O-deacylase [Dyella telluris]